MAVVLHTFRYLKSFIHVFFFVPLDEERKERRIFDIVVTYVYFLVVAKCYSDIFIIQVYFFSTDVIQATEMCICSNTNWQFVTAFAKLMRE